jgi:DNA polymerase
MPSHTSSWTGFLPRRAIVMARVDGVPAPAPAPAPATVVASTEAHDDAAAPSSAPCVLTDGNPAAQLVFVGEVDASEIVAGRPFAGPAGELLDKMIQAMGLSRERVYVCGLETGHSPAANASMLHQALAGTPTPRVLVALGEPATHALLSSDVPLASVRGELAPHLHRSGVQVMPTYHPAELLKHPGHKREAWADLQLVARHLGIKIPAKK